jgi:2-polyprenyl-3-methyl-5-hydroxy-6-metoxy-1,4-benzoquinol methylase
MQQVDLAKVAHWDSMYQCRNPSPAAQRWQPLTYDAQTRAEVIMKAIDRCRPRSILEVGCGDTDWLGYLAHATGATVAGVDYSAAGCELAKQKLAAEGVSGEIYCGDIFTLSPEKIGQYDFVYSIGLVEHFQDLKGVLTALARFVRPGGTLFTEVPNLPSMHGLLAWLWQPELLAKHRLVSRSALAKAYGKIGFQDVCVRFSGVFSIDVVAWEIYPRWPRLAANLAPKIRRFQQRVNRWQLRRVKTTRGNALCSPFIHASGTLPGGGLYRAS